MAYKVIILYQLYMPSYFLGTFTEYPCFKGSSAFFSIHSTYIQLSGYCLKADRILQQASQAVCTTIIHSTGCFLSTIDLGFRANE